MLNKIHKVYELFFLDFEKKFKTIFDGSKSIAIVGNSENLLKKKFGKQIDDHEYVIRFNRAPTKNYEEYVGQKTSLRVVGDNEFKSKDGGQENFSVSRKENEENYIGFAKKIFNSKILVITDDYENLVKNPYSYVDKSNEVYFFENRLNNIIRFRVSSKFNLIKKFNSYRNKPALSSGILIVSLLSLMKIKPSIFGFEFFDNSIFYNHYFANHKGRLTSPYHDKVHETLILKELINDQRVTFNK